MDRHTIQGIEVSFSGVYQHSIDAKGRTSLPSRFREILSAQGADKLIVTNHLIDPCLVAFTPADWQAFTDKVAKAPMFDKDIRLLTRRFVAPAQECPVDKLGRILIPPTLREQAGLGEEITWAGVVARIEAWSPARWAEVQRDAQDPAMLNDLAQRLSGFL